MHRHAAARGQPNKFGALPCEVFGPNVLAWMKERDDLACDAVESRYIRALVPIARITCQRQVFFNRLTKVLNSYDMVNLKRKQGDFFCGILQYSHEFFARDQINRSSAFSISLHELPLPAAFSAIRAADCRIAR